jgi:hypothetical protein
MTRKGSDMLTAPKDSFILIMYVYVFLDQSAQVEHGVFTG